MIEIILGIGVATFIVYTVFNITYILSMRRTSDSMTAFFRNVEGNLNAALAELRGTLENTKNITGDVGAVTQEVKQISDSVASLERSIRGLYDQMKEGLGSAVGANIAGFKAGITTGVGKGNEEGHQGHCRGHARQDRHDR